MGSALLLESVEVAAEPVATHMCYYPRRDAHVVLNFHSTRWMNQSFRTHIQIARLLARWG